MLPAFPGLPFNSPSPLFLDCTCGKRITSSYHNIYRHKSVCPNGGPLPLRAILPATYPSAPPKVSSIPTTPEGPPFVFVSSEFLIRMMSIATHDQRYDGGLFGNITQTLHFQAEVCGGKLVDVNLDSKRGGGACTITARCRKCQARVTYCTSPTVKKGKEIERTEIGARIVVASFCRDRLSPKPPASLTLSACLIMKRMRSPI